MSNQTPKIHYLTRSRAAPRKSNRLIGKTPNRKVFINTTAPKKIKRRKLNRGVVVADGILYREVDNEVVSGTGNNDWIASTQQVLESGNFSGFANETFSSLKLCLTSPNRTSASAAEEPKEQSSESTSKSFVFQQSAHTDEKTSITPDKRVKFFFSPQATTIGCKPEIQNHVKRRYVKTPIRGLESRKCSSADAEFSLANGSRRYSQLLQRKISFFGEEADHSSEEWEMYCSHDWAPLKVPMTPLPSSTLHVPRSSGNSFPSLVSSPKKSVVFKTPVVINEGDQKAERMFLSLHDSLEISSRSLEGELRKEIEEQNQRIRSLKRKASLLEQQYEAEQLLRSSSEASEVAAMESRNAAIAMLTEVMRTEKNHIHSSLSESEDDSRENDSTVTVCKETIKQGREELKDDDSQKVERISMQECHGIQKNAQTQADDDCSKWDDVRLHEKNMNYAENSSINLATRKTSLERKLHTPKSVNFAGCKLTTKSPNVLFGLHTRSENCEKGRTVMSRQEVSMSRSTVLDLGVPGGQDRALTLEIKEMRRSLENLRVDCSNFSSSTEKEIREAKKMLQECHMLLMNLIVADKTSLEKMPLLSANFSKGYSFGLPVLDSISPGAHTKLSTRGYSDVGSCAMWKKSNHTAFDDMWNESLLILPPQLRNIVGKSMVTIYTAFYRKESDSKLNHTVSPF
jgi:hypothetical protein